MMFNKYSLCIFIVVLIIICIACHSDEELKQPHSQIIPFIPSCNKTTSAPNLLYETEDSSFYEMMTGNQAVSNYCRVCKGNDVKLFMIITEFNTEDEAITALQYYLDAFSPVWIEDELPIELEHKPEHFTLYGTEMEPSLIEGDEHEFGTLAAGVFFQVGRYVGDYSIGISFPSTDLYFKWRERYWVGAECWIDLCSVIDETVGNMQANPL